MVSHHEHVTVRSHSLGRRDTVPRASRSCSPARGTAPEESDCQAAVPETQSPNPGSREGLTTLPRSLLKGAGRYSGHIYISWEASRPLLQGPL